MCAALLMLTGCGTTGICPAPISTSKAMREAMKQVDREWYVAFTNQQLDLRDCYSGVVPFPLKSAAQY